MRLKIRKVTLGVAALLFVALCIGGASLLNDLESKVVKADNATMTVDALGNLEWEEVSGADGYEWTYTVGGVTSEKYTAEDNEANVGLAIMEAVNAARADSAESASVQFNVTASGVENATTMIYTHSFTQYIDFGYSTHDISDVDIDYATQEISLENTLIDTAVDNRWIPSATYKNDLFTIGFKTEVALHSDYGVSFFLFNDTRSVGDAALAKNANYRIRLLPGGGIWINNKGDGFGASADMSTSDNTALVLGQKYYLSMGVFDTRDIAGNVIGETVYCSRSEYDEAADDLTLLSKIEHFYTSEEIETAEIVYEYAAAYSGKDKDGNAINVERSALVVKAQGTLDKDGDGTAEVRDNYVYISSGKPTYEKLAAPTGVYYDSAEETLCWNKIDEASRYEWRVGNEAWQSVSVNKVNISSLLKEYKEGGYGYLPLYVRGVSNGKVGAETGYNVDLVTFYKTRSVVKDLTELYAFTSSTAEAYNVNKNKGAGNGGYYYETTSLVPNTHVTFSFTTNELTAATERFVLLRLFRNETDNFYTGQYNLALWGDGTIFVSPNYAQTTNVDTSSTLANTASNFRVAQITDGFKVGVKYYVTFGVDEIYESETKVAHRITVRIAEETENGLSRNTLGVASYDFKHFDKWTEGNWIQLGAHSDIVSLWQAKNTDSVSKILFEVDNKIVATKQVGYGEWYDFSEEMSSATVDGYSINGWTYKENDKLIDFIPSGYWNKNVGENGFLVEATITPIEYKVSYSVSSGATSINPSKYTIESEWSLAAPVNLPTGKLFAGWYEVGDTDFSDPITTLKGKTGDIELVARIVNGYTISVNDQTFTWQEGNEAFTLIAPDVQGKTFVKWQVLSGAEYVDYTGETTFVPDESMSFKAIYDWTTYSITYVAEGATHQNATSYTLETPLILTAATKEGEFFLGWYKEDTFLTNVETTMGFAEDLTLYAKFEKVVLPTALTYDTSSEAQFLPVPQLPDGSQYTVELYKGEEKLELTDNAYVFASEGAYTIKYKIILPTSEEVLREVALSVEKIYTVNVYYGDGEMLTLKKKAGDKLTATDIPETPEGVIYGGVYIDDDYQTEFDMNTEISSSINVYVKWITEEPEQEDGIFAWLNLSGCKSSVGVGSLALVGFASVVLLFKKKKED